MPGHLEVAGGGIAGLTAGLAFARMGWSVRVHEQDDALRIPGAGIYIWENGQRVLETLGVLDVVRAGAIPATMHEKRDHDGTVFASGGFAPDFRLIVPERRTLLTALANALAAAGGELVFGSRPVAALPEGTLIFADGTSAGADLVIGADGINSRVRDSLGLLAWRKPARQFGYRIMIPRRPEELATAMGRAHCENWNGSRRLPYAPCTTELAYVQLTSVAGDTRANQVPIDRALWRDLFPRHHWVIDRIPDNGHGDWFEILKLKEWSQGRVAIIGDAASAQPPFLGQGGGCAMMSGLSLAHMVAALLSGRDRRWCCLCVRHIAIGCRDQPRSRAYRKITASATPVTTARPPYLQLSRLPRPGHRQAVPDARRPPTHKPRHNRTVPRSTRRRPRARVSLN
jgi:2-polyprenyl-6-methoxyphenol hydroxylase-like FAD-dependent oxidoreductase